MICIVFLFVLTFSDFVQHHSDLLVVQQSLLQKLDKDTISEATGAQFKSLGILAARSQTTNTSYILENKNCLYI